MSKKNTTHRKEHCPYNAGRRAFVLVIALMLSLMCACGGKETGKEPGHITAFQFNAGSYFGGYYEFSIRKTKSDYVLLTRTYNGLELPNGEVILTDDDMETLLSITNRHDLRSWDGFDKSDNDVMDGHSFTLSAEFEDGSTIEAYGYMKYPKGYDDAAAELYGFFEEKCKENQPYKKSADQNGSQKDREKARKKNAKIIAKALGIEEDAREMSFILNAMEEIGAGTIQRADMSDGGSDSTICIIAEDGTEYLVYLSASGGVDAILNRSTQDWEIISVR